MTQLQLIVGLMILVPGAAIIGATCLVTWLHERRHV